MVTFTHADVLTDLRTHPDGMWDACLCDPPYGLSFMGKEWDHGVPSVEVWREVLRVLKPGAMLLAFGGTRTHHRLMCAIEDAGFEIRDCLMWLYGSGFPKSLDISKAIDKAAGAVREQHQPGNTPAYQRSIGNTRPYMSDPNHTIDGPVAVTDAARTWSGYGTALKPAWEPIILAMKPLAGTFAENALAHGVAGLAIDVSRIGVGESIPGGGNGKANHGGRFGGGAEYSGTRPLSQPNTDGRWPANLLLGEEAAGMLDEQSGFSTTPSTVTRGKRKMKFGMGEQHDVPCFGDSGGASRFFYCAKASSRERGEGNNHPTVKPLALAEYLARLILPPARANFQRSLLIPYSGSGSEAIGAVRAGWEFIYGIDNEAAYVEIARRRAESALPSSADPASTPINLP